MMRYLIATAVAVCLSAGAASAFLDVDNSTECRGNSCNPVTANGGDGGDASAINSNLIFSSPSARGGNSESDASAVIRNSGNSEADALALSGSHSGSESDSASSLKSEITFEASNIPKNSAASPAAVYVDMCSGGASVSTPGGGATLGGGSDFCKKLALAEAYFRADAECVKTEDATCPFRDLGYAVLKDAENDLNRGQSLIQLLQLDRVPFLRHVL